MGMLAAGFLPLVVIPGPQQFGPISAAAALLVSAALLAIGTAAVFPFEMDTIVSLADNTRVATHYGFYNTIVGVGILVGNLATGTVVGAARTTGTDWAIWVGLTVIGTITALALYLLNRQVPTPQPSPVPRRHSGRGPMPRPRL